MRRGDFNKMAVNILTAYVAACILYENGQRSGVITNLRIDEFQKREPSEYDTDEMIIPCLHHKTGAQGMASLVVTRDIEHKLIEYYTIIRKRIRPRILTHANRFFLTNNGLLYTQVYRKICQALSVGKLKPPRPKDYRVVVTTDAARELNDTDLRRVIKHLSHSHQTSRQYYQFANTNDAILAHQALRDLSERRKWSKEHTMALLKEWPLKRSPPSLPVCKKISQKYRMERTGKEILNKWRQMKLLV